MAFLNRWNYSLSFAHMEFICCVDRGIRRQTAQKKIQKSGIVILIMLNMTDLIDAGCIITVILNFFNFYTGFTIGGRAVFEFSSNLPIFYCYYFGALLQFKRFPAMIFGWASTKLVYSGFSLLRFLYWL